MITVFTSCYNQAGYLDHAIRSVLNQTYKDFEYLLYDDGSTDKTWEIMQKYAKKDSRIRATKLSKQANVGVVIRKSIEEAKGDVWSWCPSDDLWYPNLLEEKKKVAEQYPNAVLYSDFIRMDENEKDIKKVEVERLTPEELSEAIWNRCPIGFTGIWIPMKIFDEVGSFPAHMPFSEDFWWMVKSAGVHKVEYRLVPKVLYRKRAHKNTLTSKNTKKIIDNMPNIWAEHKGEKH